MVKTQKKQMIAEEEIETSKSSKVTNFLKRTIKGYFHVVTNVAKDIPKRGKDLNSFLSSTVTRVKNTKTILKANLNDPDVPLMEENFKATLIKWKIKEIEVPLAIKYYKKYMKAGFIGLIFVLIYFIISLFLPYHYPFFTQISLIIFSIASLLLTLSCYWRAKVLEDRKFEPFFKWLLK